MSNDSLFLRRALLADAIASGATAALLIAGAGALSPLTSLPEALLRYAGASLVPFVALLAWLGTRSEPSRRLSWLVVALNAVWVIDSVALLFTGWVSPNALGTAFVLAQAFAVGVLAELQYIGLRRWAAAHPAMA